MIFIGEIILKTNLVWDIETLFETQKPARNLSRTVSVSLSQIKTLNKWISFVLFSWIVEFLKCYLRCFMVKLYQPTFFFRKLDQIWSRNCHKTSCQSFHRKGNHFYEMCSHRKVCYIQKSLFRNKSLMADNRQLFYILFNY